jgi:hypothetical protein
MYLLESGKQLVITSPDVNPIEITALDEIFHSYFEYGLMVSRVPGTGYVIGSISCPQNPLKVLF